MSTQDKPGDIHLHIESLVLQGFSGLDAAGLTAALQDALTTELSTLSAPWQRASVRRAYGDIVLPASLQGQGGSQQLSLALAQALREIIHDAGDSAQPVTEPRDG